MLSLERLKTYFWYFFGIMGVVFFWTGVWDGIGNISYLENPLISFGTGLILLGMYKFVFKERGSLIKGEKSFHHIFHEVHKHPLKHQFHIIYHDNIKKKEVSLKVKHLQRIEKDFLIFVKHGGKEVFVPFHRVTQVRHKEKTYWKA